MMASSSSSSSLTDHLLQDDLPWPPPSLPFAPALHSTIGANHQWSQPLILNCSGVQDELHEALLMSAQQQGGHHHSQQEAASPLISPQLSSLLMMQDLGFPWSSCGGVGDIASMLIGGQQDGHHRVKEEEALLMKSLSARSSSASSCAGTATAYHHDGIVVDGCGGLPAMAAGDLDGGAVVLPSVNVPRQAPPPLLPGDALEILASSRLCKSLLLTQAAAAAASSVVLHNGVPLLRSEHVPYGPPPPAASAAHPQGPSIDNYKMGGVALANGGGGGGGRHWSSEHNAAACQKAALAAPSPSPKKPRVESRSSTIVSSFKVRKEKLGDRIAALQQLVSPFGKTDTASVLMEAIGYIKFLQDQVETLSGPYLRSSRNKKARTTQRGSSKSANAGEEEEARPDLRSRGLCLVPLSCTSYVTNENGVWPPPNFRGN